MRDVYLPRGEAIGAHTFTNLSAFPRLDPAIRLPYESDPTPFMDPYTLLDSYPELSLEFAPLPPGERGRWYPDLHVIFISDRLTQVERRCTLMHELVHRMRGDVHVADDLIRNRLERACHVEAARFLITLPDLADAMLWASHPAEVAEALWVDEETLQLRVEALHPSERGFVRRRMAVQEATA